VSLKKELHLVSVLFFGRLEMFVSQAKKCVVRKELGTFGHFLFTGFPEIPHSHPVPLFPPKEIITGFRSPGSTI